MPVCVWVRLIVFHLMHVPQDAEARQELEAKDERHAEELKTVEAKYEDRIQDLETKFQEVETARGALEDADVEKVRQEHEAEMRAKDVKIQYLETKFQEVETARGTLEMNLRQKVVD